MNLTLLYAISIAAITASLIARHVASIISTLLITRFQYYTIKHIVYPLLVRRKYWTGVTRFQGSLICSYIAINGFCMGLGIKSTSDLILRSGTMASINLIPLFLGGRTNVFTNLLGISLHTYYLAHHWIGRVVIIQSLVHVGLVIASGKPWTMDSIQISGISGVSALALILVSSLFMIRRLAYEIFLKLHFLFALVVVFSLWKHVSHSGIQKSVFPIVTLSLWVSNFILRLAIMTYRNTGTRIPFLNQATITQYTHTLKDPTKSELGPKFVSAIRVTVSLKRPLKIHSPGQYTYLFLSDMGIRQRFQSHPYVISWWDDSMNAKEIDFIIEPQDGISSTLVARNSIRSVVIDGPYGKNHHLEDYETVILVARGIGIAGILPYIRHMTYRRASTDKQYEAYRRRMITRKLDVYWILDHNYEEDWVSEWLAKLQEKDSQKLFLTFSCFYPNQREKPPPIPSDDYWRFIYQRKPLPIIENLIIKQIQRSAGRTKVAVCGNSEFSGSIRSIVLKSMDQYNDIEFAELEFQPQGGPKTGPVIHSSNDNRLIQRVSTKRQSMGRLVQNSRLAGESTIKKLRSGSKIAEYNDKKRLKARAQLKVIEEADEISDSEMELIGEKSYNEISAAQSFNKKTYEKEIV